MTAVVASRGPIFTPGRESGHDTALAWSPASGEVC